jgi:hypothetical protein
MTGVILCAFQSEDTLDACLAPWLATKRAHPGDYIICAVSVPFEGFPQDPPDRTRQILDGYAATGEIDHLITSDQPMKETEARGRALRWLVEKGAALTVMVDSDETWSQEQITAALAFVDANPWVQWFRVPYKQMVFTRDQWLAQPFIPARIHRTHIHGGYVAAGFWDDNNVFYRRPWEADGKVVRDAELACLVIPQALVWVSHETWLSNARSRAKVRYQTSRGWQCSFCWDEATDSLRFNDAYYALTGECIPEVVHA